jgi:hypothetical protein
MDGISLIGRVVDRRYLEGQPNPTDEFDLRLQKIINNKRKT